MRTRKRLIILVLLILAVAGAGLLFGLLPVVARAQTPTATQQFAMTWDVVASGGTTMSSSSFTLLSTTGQPVAGPAANEQHTLLSGFWQDFKNVWEMFLPIIVK